MQQIGRYHVLEEIARGGMGVVYKALDPATDRVVAIKVLPAWHLEPRAIQRLRREAKALARLAHPGVVRVHELGDHKGTPFLVLEYVAGVSLQEQLDREGPFRVRQAVEIVTRIAEALEAAHAVGVLHRDLKPSNVLIRPGGDPILIDFGLSNALTTDSTSRLTRSGQFMGTPGYWAPEQAQGQRDLISEATDVYGLGATLYALLTGRPPHEGQSLIEALGQVGGPVEPPSSHNPDVPPWLDAVLARALDAEPGRRHASVGELAQALAPPQLDDSPAPRRWALPLSLAIALAGVVASLTLTRPRAEAPTTPLPSESPDPAEMAADAALERGRTLLREGRPQEAKVAFSEVLRLRPDDTKAYVNRAMARGALGDYQGQLEDSGQAIRIQPDYVDAYHVHGAANNMLGDDEAALEALAHAIRLEPQSPVGHTYRGVVHYKVGAYPEAIANFSEAIRVQPDYPNAYVNRGGVLREQGEWAGAIEDFERALELDPSQDAVRRSLETLRRKLAAFTDAAKLGSRLSTAGQYEEAHAALSEALDLRPDARTYVGRGFVRGKLGDHQGEVDDCTEAIRLDPQFHTPYFNRAVVRARLGDRVGALADLDEAIRLEPDFPQAISARGNYRLRQGDAEGAIDDFNEAIRLEPATAHYHSNRAVALISLERHQDALVDVEEALRLDPQLGTAYYSRATIRYQAGDLAGAAIDFERVLELDPSDADARGNLELVRRAITRRAAEGG